MTHLGIEVPRPVRKPSRAHALLASAIWIAVSLPFLYLASLYWNWPVTLFSQWRGWVFSVAGLACIVMATAVPPRYRVAIAGTRVKAWARIA